MKENKVENKSKTQTSIVSRTKRSLERLDNQEKHLNERIVRLQKRIDVASKLLDALNKKQKELTSLKEARLVEIQQLVTAFAPNGSAKISQVKV